MTFHPLATLALAASLGPLAAAQTDSAPEAVPTDRVPTDRAPTDLEQLQEVLRGLDERRSLVIDGKVTSIEPESSMGGAMVVMRGMGGGDTGAKFEGPFQVWRTEKGEVVMTSRQELPGFACFDNGDRKIVQTTVEEEPLDMTSLRDDLAGVLDFHRQAKLVENVELEVERDTESGRVTYRGELPKRLIRSAGGGMMSFMNPQVLRVETVFVLSANGELESATYGVVRNDPMADMRERAMKGELGDGEGRMRISTSGAMPEASKKDGAVTVFELRASTDRPSKRSVMFLDDVRELLGREEF